MKILVTGGAGYIGTTLIPLLLDQRRQVAVFDSLRYGIGPLLPFFRLPGFSFLRGDIRDKQTFEDFARDADAVVHLAAIVGYPACARAPEEAKAINIEGTRNVAAAAGRRPVVFASTSSCYGLVTGGSCTEETPLRPLTLYGESKAQGEDILRNQCNAVVYRIGTAFGLSPRLRLDLLVNNFTYQALRQRRLRVYEGHARRNFLHVADIARAIILALENHDKMAGQVYNVGDESQNRTKLDICRLIAQFIPGTQIEESSEGRDPDQRNYDVSFARLKNQGFQAEVSLEQGVRELCGPLPWIENPEQYSN